MVDDYRKLVMRSIESVRERTKRRFNQPFDMAAISQILQMNRDRVDQAWEKITSAHTPDCQSGCSYCCHINVSVTPLEVFVIADHINSLPDGERGLLAESIAARAMEIEGKNINQRRTPCGALRESGECGIYGARPLACRAYHSFSVEGCKDDLSGRIGKESRRGRNPLIEDMAQSIGLGTALGLRDVGLDAPEIELTVALDIVLNMPDAFSRWQMGGKIFDRAKVPPPPSNKYTRRGRALLKLYRG